MAVDAETTGAFSIPPVANIKGKAGVSGVWVAPLE